MSVKLNRYDPVSLPSKVRNAQWWFYVNSGSITVCRRHDAGLEIKITRRYLERALEAMRRKS